MEKSNNELFYVGTFTEYMYVLELDTENEKFTMLNKIQCEKNSSYICLSNDKQYLYTANEFYKGVGGVSAYSLADKKCPQVINTISSNTEGPCHLSQAFADGKKYLLSAGYFDGRVHVYPINEDGSIMDCSCIIQHHGGGPFINHPTWISSQDQSRAHFIVQVPGTPFILCTDLGDDKIYVYTLKNNQLVEVGFCKMFPGSGPRHLALHPSGKTLYLISELNSTIVVLDFDRDKGTLQPCQHISTLPENLKNDSWCAAVHISKDGRFLYGSNRGHNSIALFKVEDDGKRLVSTGYLTQAVSYPREFQIDPTGRHMIVANQDTKSLSLYRICNETGVPEFTGKTISIEQPVCIEFL